MKLPDLSGLWGMERFGLTDIRVLKALEGLEGVEQCALYRLIEERSTAAAEKARLEKLVQSKSKQVSLLSLRCGQPASGSCLVQRDGALILKVDAGLEQHLQT